MIVLGAGPCAVAQACHRVTVFGLPKNPEFGNGVKLFKDLTLQFTTTQFTVFVACFETIFKIDFKGTLNF